MKIQTFKDLLEIGCKIEVPFKEKINDWYSSISLIKRKYTHQCVVYYTTSLTYDKYVTSDEAIMEFCKLAFTSKNVGYVQTRLEQKGIDMEMYDLEKPCKELKKLFKDEAIIVDKEFVLE